ncbi:hypothetical protein EB796_006428 [Bugula neritina]|uniref:GAL3ST1 n=1 Tax=Bugula neritina TaxID=10212 RepID=A0A7J7K9E6_BUGNE|nr:hypothetical protein EB796_006428 [Bugula neritina]
MYTILSRFALDRKLDIITPDRPVYLLLNSPGKKGKVWKIGPKNHSKGDVVMHHAIYKDYLYDKYLKAGYKLIVSVREPVAWFKSAVKFYHKEVKDKNAEEIILNSKYFHEKRRLFHNRQLHYLGFTNPYGRFNMSEVKDFIAKMINRVDIIILNEQYDASLLIMMKRFGWKYSDLFYNKMRVLNTFNNSFSNRAIDKLLSKEYNLRDKIYYKEMNKTWWAQPELLEEGFWDEVL